VDLEARHKLPPKLISCLDSFCRRLLVVALDRADPEFPSNQVGENWRRILRL